MNKKLYARRNNATGQVIGCDWLPFEEDVARFHDHTLPTHTVVTTTVDDGDWVVDSSLKEDDWAVSTSGGVLVRVVSGPDSDGDYLVRQPNGLTTFYAGDQLTPLDKYTEQ